MHSLCKQVFGLWSGNESMMTTSDSHLGSIFLWLNSSTRSAYHICISALTGGGPSGLPKGDLGPCHCFRCPLRRNKLNGTWVGINAQPLRAHGLCCGTPLFLAPQLPSLHLQGSSHITLISPIKRSRSPRGPATPTSFLPHYAALCNLTAEVMDGLGQLEGQMLQVRPVDLCSSTPTSPERVACLRELMSQVQDQVMHVHSLDAVRQEHVADLETRHRLEVSQSRCCPPSPPPPPPAAIPCAPLSVPWYLWKVSQHRLG